MVETNTIIESQITIIQEYAFAQQILEKLNNNHIYSISDDPTLNQYEITYDVIENFYKQNQQSLSQFIKLDIPQPGDFELLNKFVKRNSIIFPSKLVAFSNTGQLKLQDSLKVLHDTAPQYYNDIQDYATGGNVAYQQFIENIQYIFEDLNLDDRVLKVIFKQSEGQHEQTIKIYTNISNKGKVLKLFKQGIRQSINHSFNDKAFDNYCTQIVVDDKQYNKIKMNVNVPQFKCALQALLNNHTIIQQAALFVYSYIRQLKSDQSDKFSVNPQYVNSSQIIIFPQFHYDRIIIDYFQDILINNNNYSKFVQNSILNTVIKGDDVIDGGKISEILFKLVNQNTKQHVYMCIQDQEIVNYINRLKFTTGGFRKYKHMSDQQLVKVLNYDSVQQWLDEWYQDQFSRQKFFNIHKDDLKQSMFKLIR